MELLSTRSKIICHDGGIGWVKTAGIWNYDELARQYINSCWDARAANLGAFAFQQNTIIRLYSEIQRGAAIEISAAA